MPTPSPGQKSIPLGDWKRFLRVADWFERTVEQGRGVFPPTYGNSVIVKTPTAGIDARDDTTISSATCVKCVAVETSTAGERTIHETSEELVVYNFHLFDVAGDEYIKTALSPKGTRYAELSSGPLVPVELDGALSLYGSATVTHLNHAGVRTDTTETAYDILGFYEGEDGDRGWCERMGDGKLKFVSLSCDPPGDGPAQETADELPPETFGSPEPDPDPLLESSSDITLDAFAAFGSPQNF